MQVHTARPLHILFSLKDVTQKRDAHHKTKSKRASSQSVSPSQSANRHDTRFVSRSQGVPVQQQGKQEISHFQEQHRSNHRYSYLHRYRLAFGLSNRWIRRAHRASSSRKPGAAGAADCTDKHSGWRSCPTPARSYCTRCWLPQPLALARS